MEKSVEISIRYEDALRKSQDVLQALSEQIARQEQDASVWMREADRKLKRILGETFGEDDFGPLPEGVDLLAVTEDGKWVITELLAALQPILLEGTERCARELAQRAVAEAKLERARRGGHR